MIKTDALQNQLDQEIELRMNAEESLLLVTEELAQVRKELRSSTVALKEQSERTSAILDNAAEGIVTFNEQNIIDSFNPAAEKIFGILKEEAIGRNYGSLFKNTHGRSCDDFDNASGQNNKFVPMGIRNDGDLFPVSISLSSALLPTGWINTAIIRDVTRRIELERQLTQAQKLESIGQLAAGIAHEINTPIQYVGDNARFLGDAFKDLTKVLMLYEELSASVKNAKPTEELATQIEKTVEAVDLEFICSEVPEAIQQTIDGVERVVHIVRAMKDFAHPSQNTKSPIDINRAITSTTSVCRNEWKYLADLKLDLGENLPMISVHPSDLNQTILNIVVNGAHAIQEKLGEHSTDKGIISISSRQDEDVIEIRITDSGTGIPKSIREKIYDPFFTTKNVGRGTGQGLSIAYNAIVEKHGGELIVESEEGEGTTFFIRLPIED